MTSDGYAVRETDPIETQQPLAVRPAAVPPIVGRLQAMWDSMRGKVLQIFPTPPGLPQDKDDYLHSVDEIYRNDAYHSLSIEGYTVSVELIERVRAGNWNPDNRDADRQSRNALA